MDVFLNSFIPLCATKKGRMTSKLSNIPPFVDGSCRREPDFEKDKPAITGLCRTDKLIPRLKQKDLIIYLTNKRKYYNDISERFFVGILEVEYILDSHNDAMKWYNTNEYTLSQNIICDSTEPFASEFTHRIVKYKLPNGEANIKAWNNFYKLRSRNYPPVAQCKIWNNQLNLINPRNITDEEMIEIFNRVPRAQNPPKLKEEEWEMFKEMILK